MGSTVSTHRDVIVLLGGATALGRALGLNPVNTTGHWGRRGVPGRYRLRLAEMAAAKGVRINSETWDQLRLDQTESQAEAA